MSERQEKYKPTYLMERVSQKRPAQIPPLYYEVNLLPDIQSRVDLIVEVGELCNPKKFLPDETPKKISEMIARIRGLQIGNSKSLISRLEKAYAKGIPSQSVS